MKKNSFGYYRARRKKLIIINLIAFGIPAITYVVGLIAFKTNANLFTLAAVLGVLPAAQQLINLIMILKAVKYEADSSLMEKINDSLAEKNISVEYDFYITSYSIQYPITALFVAEDSIIGITPNKDFKNDSFTEHVNNILAQNNLKVGIIKIFGPGEEDKFLSRIKSLSDKNYENTDKDMKLLQLLENISL